VRQRIGDPIEHRLDDQLGIPLAQMRAAGGKFLDEFRFGHIGEPDVTVSADWRTRPVKARGRFGRWRVAPLAE
jgi:hypothetical protein